MNIRIVCYEDVHGWILGKFALKLEENLSLLGHQVSISNTVDKNADINHHIIHWDYKFQQNGVQTLMITHIDSSMKLDVLKKQLLTADMGICMSRDTMNSLVNLGAPREKLCYVNPAHDGVIKPQKEVIGITCRVQLDGRKREYFLGKLAKVIDPELFSFFIMGDGWDEQIQILRNAGFEVSYINHFDYTKYVALIPTLNYYLYMGQDEGQMGFVDAVSAGVPTIVTLQGYHLDAANGISYGFNTFQELSNHFNKISSDKRKYIDSVKYWTWKDYTHKHLEIWQYLTSEKSGGNYNHLSNEYIDGLCSVYKFDKTISERSKVKAFKDFLKLYYGSFKLKYFMWLNNRMKNSG